MSAAAAVPRRNHVRAVRILVLLIGISSGCRWLEPSAQQTAAFTPTFASSLAEKRVRFESFELQRQARPVLVALVMTARKLLKREFRSDPFEVGPDAVLTGAICTHSFGLPLQLHDVPRFLLKARGPAGSSTLLDETLGARLGLDEWLPYRVRIPPEIGSPIVLEFTLEHPPEGKSLTRMATAAWAIPRVLDASNERKPNILLIVLDTLRADRTGVYGYERDTTPFLDRLARQAVTVEEAVAPYPTTLASHWSLFSGLHPVRHGIYRKKRVQEPPKATLPRALRGTGYQTVAFTEGGFVHSFFGFGRGFDLYHNGPDTGTTEFSGAAADTFALAENWIRENGDARFFMFLHTYQVHTPYSPPRRYLEMFEHGYSGRWENSYPVGAAFQVNNGKLSLTSDQLQHIRDLYDAEIRQLDDLLADLWLKLEAMGALENTIVVITSDHGEDHGEHGWFHHGTTLYDPALLVPLMILWPDHLPKGVRLDCQRPLTDLMPTLLELAGVDPPPNLDGASFAPEVRAGSCIRDQPAYSELVFSDFREQDGLPLASVRNEGWKFILNTETGVKELYELAKDPGESHNLIQSEPDRTNRFSKMTHDYLSNRSAPLEPLNEIPPEMERQLRGLGYVE